MHVIVDGLIGVGKTTLCEKLESAMECTVLNELGVDTSLLGKFYADPERYGFLFQVHMLNKRYADHKKIAREEGKVWIQDRGIYADVVFMKTLFKEGKISALEYTEYMSLWENMKDDLKYPELIIFLDCPPEVCMEHIKKRGRECEKDIPIEYLEDLEKEYHLLMEDLAEHSPLIRLPFSEYSTSVENIVDAIRSLPQ